MQCECITEVTLQEVDEQLRHRSNLSSVVSALGGTQIVYVTVGKNYWPIALLPTLVRFAIILYVLPPSSIIELGFYAAPTPASPGNTMGGAAPTRVSV